MASVNKVIIIGNLGADPEVRSFQSGGRIATMRIATSESWKDKNTGEQQQRTEWHSVVVTSDGLVGVVERYLRKGSKIYIEGSLKTRKWQDQSGADRYTTEVVVGGPKATLVMLDGAGGGQDSDRGNGGSWGGNAQRGGGRSSGQASGRGGAGRSNTNRSDDGGWGSGSGSQGGFADDLDDDIPF